MKIPHGGWFALIIGAILVVQMTTWRRGRQLVAANINRGERPIESVVHQAIAEHAARVEGTAVYLFKDGGFAPPALIANLKHNHALHRMTLMVSVHTADTPHVDPSDRVAESRVGKGIFRVDLSFGFLDDPNVPEALSHIEFADKRIDPAATSYFIGREAVTATDVPGMAKWREHLYVGMSRSASNAARFFSLPPDRVFEVGTFVGI